MGWVNVNIDAATFTEMNAIGIGNVIRDDGGNFLRVMCKKVGVLRQARDVEAISLKEALTSTKRHRYTMCVFETDSKFLADAYNAYNRGVNSYFHLIVRDFVEMAKHFDNVIVQFMHRSANAVAHLLA